MGMSFSSEGGRLDPTKLSSEPLSEGPARSTSASSMQSPSGMAELMRVIAFDADVGPPRRIPKVDAAAVQLLQPEVLGPVWREGPARRWPRGWHRRTAHLAVCLARSDSYPHAFGRPGHPLGKIPGISGPWPRGVATADTMPLFPQP